MRAIRNACVGSQDRGAQRGRAEISVLVDVQPLVQQHQFDLGGHQFQRVVQDSNLLRIAGELKNTPFALSQHLRGGHPAEPRDDHGADRLDPKA